MPVHVSRRSATLLGFVFAGAVASPALVRGEDTAPVQQQEPVLDTIVVEGVRAKVEGAGVVLTVPVDPLEATDLADLLSTLPGVQVRSSGGLGSYSEASLRGSSGRQVRILLDGLPLDVGGGEATSLSLVNPLLLEEVKVYQGRVPVSLGSGLAGSIDLRTRRQLAEPLVGTLGLGTLGERQASAGAQLSEDVQLLGGYQHADNDFRYANAFKPFDPDDPERKDKEKRRNAGTEQTYGLLRYHGPLVFTLHGVDDEQELPTRLNRDTTRTELRTRSLGASVTTPAESAWQASLSHRYTAERYRDPDSELGLGGAQDTRQQSRATRLAVGHDVGPAFDQLRIEHQEFRTRDAIGDTSGPSARRLSIGNGIETGWGSLWRFDASLNAAWSNDESQTQEDKYWQVEPALGLTRAVGVCIAAANVGHRKRLPTFFERYGDRGLFRGNPTLDPERSAYADAGARCAMESWVRHAQLTVFGQDLRDAISPTFTAQGVGRSINTDKAEIFGVEMAVGGGAEAWSWDLSGTWQHTEDRSDTRATRGNALPGRFENQLNARLERRLAGLTFFYAFRFESGQYYDSAQLLRADVMRRHDVGVRGALRRLGWSLQWLNVGDDNFEQFNGFPTPGERVRFSLTWPETRRPASIPDSRSTP
ncbi:outer membrane cobalamin receptor [Panacagrimonas perspica]|uniref:Outer membrane cobalamin receptor n=1 Tax=Panacagrimonas perspica TaxID=381431 RepID=A0A4S3K717_9GAMM|nr:TonB-dependent receptor plug domain-containing protein [Panacagrimonas perspica]TDU26591.1 outer membrane cobalamin receptor [Panacagrimonas perspica]THD03956.1 hypothetical protein B1810_06725 [Panacagrimonas perspica]